MSTPIVGSKFTHKWLIDYPTPPEETEPQLPNEFTVVGTQVIASPDGGASAEYIGVIQTGQTAPLPTWWAPDTVSDLFAPITPVPIPTPSIL